MEHGVSRRPRPPGGSPPAGAIAIWRLAATGTADPALLTQAAMPARHAHDLPQTIALLEALPDKHQTTATDLRLGGAYLGSGCWNRAEATLARAAAGAVGEQETLAVALVRTTSLLWSNAPVTEAFAVNDDAMSLVTSPADRRKLKINEGFLRIASGQPVHGLTLLEDLETEVGAACDINVWARGAWMESAGLALVGRTAEAAAWARRVHAVHRRAKEGSLASHPGIQRISLVLALTEAGLSDDARREGERAYAELTASGAGVRVWMAVVLGRTHWPAGHPAAARGWWAEAAALARAIDHAMALRLVLGGLAACAAVLGDLEAAETALAEHRDLPLPAPGMLSAGEERLGEAWLLAARGHLGRARSVLTAAARTARASGHVTGEALLLTDVARLGGAKEVAGRLTALAGRCDGALAPARARLAAALAADDPDQLLTPAGCRRVPGRRRGPAGRRGGQRRRDRLAPGAPTAPRRGGRPAGRRRPGPLRGRPHPPADQPPGHRRADHPRARDRPARRGRQRQQGHRPGPDPVGAHRRQPPPPRLYETRRHHPARTGPDHRGVVIRRTSGSTAPSVVVRDARPPAARGGGCAPATYSRLSTGYSCHATAARAVSTHGGNVARTPDSRGRGMTRRCRDPQCSRMRDEGG